MVRDSFMDLARELAERGRYTTAPNPLVGAVIARNGAVVSEGWHVRPGEEHAEAMALRRAGSEARGGTMYVTLEPCNCHSRTPGPPCAEAVLRSGIGRVVVGHLDPNPRMNGRSIELLREAGVEVEVLDDPVFERQNEQFFWSMRTGRPFVHLKLAATLDGRIAASSGDSRWITGEQARHRAHRLRAEAGAVLVGAGTVRADDPLLTARGLAEEPPGITRVVLDPRLTTSPESRLARTAGRSPVLVYTDRARMDGREGELLRRGVEVVPAPVSPGGLDLEYILQDLGRRGLRGLLVEGGGKTAGRFLERGLVNKLTLFYAPKVLGSDGMPMVGALGAARVAQALRFSVTEVEMAGEDVAVTLYPASSAKEEGVHRTG